MSCWRPTDSERDLLSPFKTSANRVYLHRDRALMPKGRRFWSGWNYRMPNQNTEAPEVTYWMNLLQKLDSPDQHFVSLNPQEKPRADLIDGTFDYRHPMFNDATMDAQKNLWSLQGEDRVWAGLAVAEQLGGVRRPWNVKDESSRIHLGVRHQPLLNDIVESAE
jgi:uncharacterized protein